MLDRLPLELVQHIVFLTLPSSSSFTKYRERQDTLLALCLTSSVLRDIAQPVLFQSVALKSDHAHYPRSFLDVVEANEALGQHVRALRLQGAEDVVSSSADRDFSRFAAHCPNVVEVMLYHEFANLQSLEVFPRLKRLVCSHDRLRITLPLRLPHLQELSLTCTTTSRFHALPPASLPSLQALHLQCIQIGPMQPEALEPFKPDQVALSCDACDIIFHEGPDVQLHVLHDCATVALDDLLELPKRAKHLRSLRLNPFAGANSLEAAKSFDTLQRTLNECLSYRCMLENPWRLPSLSAIYLPSSYLGRAFDYLDPISRAGFSLRQLKRHCASRGIELVFEDLPNPYYASMVSPEFVKRYWATKASEVEADAEVEDLSGRTADLGAVRVAEEEPARVEVACA
ncbi:hypothetical protein JCM8097_004227 [Rhodosporidiobolus ruineniae]